MVSHPVSIRFFTILQGLALLVVLGAIFLQLRRRREESQGDPLAQAYDFKSAVRRAPIPPGAARSEAQSSEEPREALGSAFPGWTDQTPPHEILGVHPHAPEEAIEAAYKSKLKLFHPDRFAHWGADYQARAHGVVLRLQSARDRMLGRRY